MGHAYQSLAFLGVIWLVGMSISILAIRAARKSGLCWLWSLLAIGVGAIGLWPPFSLWPELAYTWNNGFTIDFRWFFAAPMLLGAVGSPGTELEFAL